MLQKLLVLHQHLEPETVQLNSFPQSFLDLCGHVFDVLVLGHNSSVDFPHLFLEQLNSIKLLVRLSRGYLIKNDEDPFVPVLQLEHLLVQQPVLVSILNQLFLGLDFIQTPYELVSERIDPLVELASHLN